MYVILNKTSESYFLPKRIDMYLARSGTRTTVENNNIHPILSVCSMGLSETEKNQSERVAWSFKGNMV